MIFNPAMFDELLNEKINNFLEVINNGFNELNDTKEIIFSCNEVRYLHHFLSKNEPIPEVLQMKLTEDHYKEQKAIQEEEIGRLRKLLDGTYKAFEPTLEQLLTLQVNMDDINTCLISNEEHINLLNEVNAKI